MPLLQLPNQIGDRHRLVQPHWHLNATLPKGLNYELVAPEHVHAAGLEYRAQLVQT